MTLLYVVFIDSKNVFLPTEVSKSVFLFRDTVLNVSQSFHNFHHNNHSPIDWQLGVLKRMRAGRPPSVQ